MTQRARTHKPFVNRRLEEERGPLWAVPFVNKNSKELPLKKHKACVHQKKTRFDSLGAIPRREKRKKPSSLKLGLNSYGYQKMGGADIAANRQKRKRGRERTFGRNRRKKSICTDGKGYKSSFPLRGKDKGSG